MRALKALLGTVALWACFFLCIFVAEVTPTWVWGVVLLALLVLVPFALMYNLLGDK